MQKALLLLRKKGHLAEIRRMMDMHRSELFLLIEERILLNTHGLESVTFQSSASTELTTCSLSLQTSLETVQSLHQSVTQNHYQVSRQLAKNESLIHDVENAFDNLQNGSAQTTILLQKILDSADSGRLDPNFIYIAIPRVDFSVRPSKIATRNISLVG
jgi:hypothetical protein